MILSTDAVIYPGAMVVEVVHAFAANVAVGEGSAADCFAGWAKSAGGRVPFNELEEVCFVFGLIAGVSERGTKEECI